MTLHLTDRSRIFLGRGRCMRARYLEYHAGATGYGMRSKKESMPLVTGIGVHDPVAEILRGAVGKQLGDLYPGGSSLNMTAVARLAIAQGLDAYRKTVVESGYLEIDGTEETKYVMEEQCALLEALVWVFVKVVLPAILAEYTILKVEEETPYVLGCTCGLGEETGSLADHKNRECDGIGLMLRGDLVLERRTSKEVFILDLKTGADLGYNWKRQWERSVQLALTAVGVERALGREVNGAYIVGLQKGIRRKSKLPEDTGKNYTGPKRQESNLIYAWYRPANPPMYGEDWNLEGGKVWRTHTKLGIWTAEFPDKPAGVSNIEWWITHHLEKEFLQAQAEWVGPIPTPRRQLESLKRSIQAEEGRVLAALWEMYEERTTQLADLGDLGVEPPTRVARVAPLLDAAPEMQALLDKFFPQSWECIKYTYDCQFRSICDEQAGWEDPLGSGAYILRRPHHQEELDEMAARGIPIPGVQEEEGAE